MSECETDLLRSYGSFVCVLLLDSVHTLFLMIYVLLDLGLVEAIYDKIFSFRDVNYEDN